MKKIILLLLFLFFGVVSSETFPSFPMTIYGTIFQGTSPASGIIKIYDSTNTELASYTITTPGKYGSENAMVLPLVINQFSGNIVIKFISNGNISTVSVDQINDSNKGEGCPTKSSISFVSQNCRYDISLPQVVLGGGGGGGGGGAITAPVLPVVQNLSTSGSINSIPSSVLASINPSTIQSVQTSHYSSELKSAYLFAFTNGITTKPTIDESKLESTLTRGEMAKMMSQYAVNILGKKPNLEKKCIFKDINTAKGDLSSFIQTACQLEIMGVDSFGNSNEYFYPNLLVNRAQFATVLSRVLWGDKYNLDDENYYENHLKALQEASIILVANPDLQELRGYVMLMLMRSSD